MSQTAIRREDYGSTATEIRTMLKTDGSYHLDICLSHRVQNLGTDHIVGWVEVDVLLGSEGAVETGHAAPCSVEVERHDENVVHIPGKPQSLFVL